MPCSTAKWKGLESEAGRQADRYRQAAGGDDLCLLYVR